MARHGRRFPSKPQIRNQVAGVFGSVVDTIAYDNASSGGYHATDNNYTWTHTIAGNERLLVVGISMFSVAGSSVTGITYDGVAMTFLAAVNDAGAGTIQVELWYLIAPNVGTKTIEVTLSDAVNSIGNAVSFTGVHQTVPVEAANTATGTGAADASVNVTTIRDNDWVVDCVATNDFMISVGSGQTQRENVVGAVGTGGMSTEGPISPPGVATMSWSGIGIGSVWSIAATGIRPSGTIDIVFDPALMAALQRRPDQHNKPWKAVPYGLVSGIGH